MRLISQCAAALVLAIGTIRCFWALWAFWAFWTFRVFWTFWNRKHEKFSTLYIRTHFSSLSFITFIHCYGWPTLRGLLPRRTRRTRWTSRTCRALSPIHSRWPHRSRRSPSDARIWLAAVVIKQKKARTVECHNSKSLGTKPKITLHSASCDFWQYVWWWTNPHLQESCSIRMRRLRRDYSRARWLVRDHSQRSTLRRQCNKHRQTRWSRLIRGRLVPCDPHQCCFRFWTDRHEKKTPAFLFLLLAQALCCCSWEARGTLSPAIKYNPKKRQIKFPTMWINQ